MFSQCSLLVYVCVAYLADFLMFDLLSYNLIHSTIAHILIENSL